MILPIYLYGSEVLRNENKEADLNDKEAILKLLEDMKDTLKVADGCGLAAPQVGVNLRIVIVDGRELSDTYEYLHDFFRVMINPVVLEESEETCEYSEGCLSVPGKWGIVTRPYTVRVRAQDRFGDWFEVEGEEITARCFCHELEHLDGHLYVEHIDHFLTEEELRAYLEEDEEGEAEDSE